MADGTVSPQDQARDADRQPRPASGQRERALTLGFFYAFAGATALGSLAVGAWPGTNRSTIALLGVLAVVIGAALRLTHARVSQSMIMVLAWAGPPIIAVAQLASGSPTAAAVYGVFYIFSVGYAVSFLSIAGSVVQLALVVSAQILVVAHLGSFAYGDTRGIAAHVLTNVAVSAGVAAVMWHHTRRRQRAEAA
jgi:hypothetical protein